MKTIQETINFLESEIQKLNEMFNHNWNESKCSSNKEDIEFYKTCCSYYNDEILSLKKILNFILEK